VAGQTAYVERFNRTVRYEWPSQCCWVDSAEVQQHAANCMRQQNYAHPMQLGRPHAGAATGHGCV